MTEKKHKTEKLSAFGEMEIEATAAGSVPALPKGKTISGFREALAKNWPDFDPLVPEHVSKETLKAAMIEAVCQNPQLLLCDSRSLFSALKKCAKDGLMPDGREGVITPYKGEAAWNPMVGGLRKRARELDDIIVDADVVCANYIVQPPVAIHGGNDASRHTDQHGEGECHHAELQRHR